MSKPSLSETHPELAKEWHPTKNGDLAPYDVTFGAKKKVWWKCNKAEDHEWETPIYNRSNGTGCPCCLGQKVVPSNCLATLNPDLAQQWHPTKNGELTPSDVTLGSGKKIWWQCDKGIDHEWEAKIVSRSNGSGCACCLGQKVASSNCLARLNPRLAKEWHPTKNGELTPGDVTPGSNKKVWWKCDKVDDHEWEATVNNRNNGKGCSCCAGLTVVPSNSLATLNPELAKEWHPTKNGELTSNDVTVNSNKKVWWKCDKGDDHGWETKISDRTSKGNNCPICSRQKIVMSNCLSTTHPDLAKQWHPTKNRDLTPFNIGWGSHKKVWWKCDKGENHEWISVVKNRSYGWNCPFCTLTPQSKQELIITFELKEFFKDINPKGYKTRIDGQLKSIDIFIPLLNLAIEFDGSYWHKDKLALDKIKSEMLIDEGYKVIRIRQEPLKRIYENDIISSLPYNGKEAVDNILKRIMELYDLDSKARNKIEIYLKKDSLQNERGLDRYIDKILTEKADKSELRH